MANTGTNTAKYGLDTYKMLPTFAEECAANALAWGLLGQHYSNVSRRYPPDSPKPSKDDDK